MPQETAAPVKATEGNGNEGGNPAVETPQDVQKKSFLARKATQARNLAIRLKNGLKRNPQNEQKDSIELAKGTDDKATNEQREKDVTSILLNASPQDIDQEFRALAEGDVDQTDNQADKTMDRAAEGSGDDIITAKNKFAEQLDSDNVVDTMQQTPIEDPSTSIVYRSGLASDYAKWLQKQPGEYAADGVTINPTVADENQKPDGQTNDSAEPSSKKDSDLVKWHAAEVAAIKQPGRLSRMLPGGKTRELAYYKQLDQAKNRYKEAFYARQADNQPTSEAASAPPERQTAITDSSDSQTMTEQIDQPQLNINQLPTNLRQQAIRDELTKSTSQDNEASNAKQPTGQVSDVASEQPPTDAQNSEAQQTDPVYARLANLTDIELRLEAESGNPTAIRVLADRDTGKIGPAPVDAADLDRQRAFEDIMAIKEGGMRKKIQTAESPDASATDSTLKMTDEAEISAEEDAVMLGKSDQELLDLAFQDYNAEAQRVLLEKMEDLSDANSLEDLQKKAADGDLIAKTALEYIDHLKTLPVDTLKKRAFASSRAAQEALDSQPPADETAKQTVEATTPEDKKPEVAQLVQRLNEGDGDLDFSQLSATELQTLKQVIGEQIAAQEAKNQATPEAESPTAVSDGTSANETAAQTDSQSAEATANPTPESKKPIDAPSAKDAAVALGVDPESESGAKLFDLIDSSTPDALLGLWDKIKTVEGATAEVTKLFQEHGFKGTINPKTWYKFALGEIVAEQQKVKDEQSETDITEATDESTEEKTKLRSKIMEMLVTLAMALGAVAVEAMKGGAESFQETTRK